jgi:hypothetical protein
LNKYQAIRTSSLYIAPEVGDEFQNFTLPGDIYSFGIILIELILNETPDLKLRSSQLNRAIQIVLDIFSSLPPPPPSINISQIRIENFFRSLISLDDRARPTASEALNFIESLRNHLLIPSHPPSSHAAPFVPPPPPIPTKPIIPTYINIVPPHTMGKSKGHQLPINYHEEDQNINYDKVALLRSFSLPFSPYYITVDRTEKLHFIISDYNNHKLYIYSLNDEDEYDIYEEYGKGCSGGCRNGNISGGFLVDSFGNAGTEYMQFNHTAGLAVHHDDQHNSNNITDGGNIIIADHSNHRIQIWSREGKFIRSFGSKGSGNVEFNGPYGVALLNITHATVLVIADCYNHRIQICSAEGIFVRKFGCLGSGNVQFNCPSGVAVHPRSGNIIICDRGNHRIQICNDDGVYIRSFGSFGSDNLQFNNPYGVALLNTKNNNRYGDYHVIISDYGNHRIQICSSKGEFLRSFGSQGSGDMQFNNPFGVVVLPRYHYHNNDATKHDDNCNSPFIIIADRGNQRIQIIGEL